MRTFHISVVLSVLTGRLLCKMDDIYDILDYMTNDELYTHQLPRVSQEIAPHIWEQTQLPKEIEQQCAELLSKQSEEYYAQFINEMATQYGDYFELYPVHSEDHEQIDPVDELLQMRPDAKIIAVNDQDEISPYGTIS
jgi:hypothetical protein